MTKESSSIGGGIISIVKFISILLFLLAVLFFSFGNVIEPGYMGVKQVYYGPGTGYSDKGLNPGLHVTIPFYSVIHVFPTAVQILNLNRENKSEIRNLKTSDGALVDVDVSVIYSLYREDKEGEHGGPRELIRNLSLSPANWNRQIVGAAEKALREKLPELSASNFYDPDLRDDLTNKAAQDMRKSLSGYGIKIEDVLLRRYTYQSKRIDDAIFQKNLQDQEVRLNEAKGKFSAAQAKLEQVAAEWDAKVRTLQVRGETDAQVIRSEAQLVESELTAEADLKVSKAIAEVDRLKAGALASAQGAEIYVAREISPLIASLKGGVVSGMDPYDLNEWSNKLGVRSGGGDK